MRCTMGWVIITAVFAGLLAAPAPACSVAMCLGGGVEFRPEVAIKVIHAQHSRPGVSVTIIRSGGDGATLFSGTTGPNGDVLVPRLEPGEYWMNVEFLGISAAYHCFHVARRPSWKAKRKVKYEWGHWATDTLRIGGELVDSQPGNRVAVPIAGAVVMLQDPRTGEIKRTDSAEDGTFSFDASPETVYVLRIAGGTTGRSYEPTSLLVRLAARAPLQRLRLLREDTCGEPVLRIASSSY
ncbi:MAG: carboxypeptidase-like regulatory domain-containing protein [Bryobacteraceae bacterium]